MTPKKPATHDVKVKERNGTRTGIVGGAWANEDGSFSIRLNPGVRLSWDDDLFVTLWPRAEADDPEIFTHAAVVDRLRAIVDRPELNNWERHAFPSMLARVNGGNGLTTAMAAAIVKACKRLGVA